MIRLARITLREIRLPLVEPFQTSAGVVEARRILLLELADTGGRSTWTECVAEALPTYSPDTVDSSWLALSEWIIPLALRGSFSAPRDAHMSLDRSIRGNRMPRAAVEMGIWSLFSLQRQMPLAVLLSSESKTSREPVAGPRQFVETGIALGMHATPDALVSRAARAAKEGYRRVKLKIAPGSDVQFARAVRDALPPNVAIAVDANGSYSLDNGSHRRALEELDALGLAMIEQPLAHDDLVYHAELQQLLTTPICLDESISSDGRAEEMLALGSARVVNLKPGRVGGFQQAIAIHDRCARAEIPVWCGGMLECGIGRAYNVALASLPNFTLPGDLSPSARYWTRDVITKPWTMDDEGRVNVPLDQPGPGFDVDLDFIDDITVRLETFPAP